MHGTKAHVATGQAAGLIRGVEVTAANIHGAAELAAILPEAHNAAVRRVRCRPGKVSGTCERSCGLRRTRWPGLARAGLPVRLAARAYDLRRSFGLRVEQRAWALARTPRPGA